LEAASQRIAEQEKQKPSPPGLCESEGEKAASPREETA
jgi:hypothetical protein